MHHLGRAGVHIWMKAACTSAQVGLAHLGVVGREGAQHSPTASCAPPVRPRVLLPRTAPSPPLGTTQNLTHALSAVGIFSAPGGEPALGPSDRGHLAPR